MEMIGGSSAPHLACTPCVPLFCTLFNKGGNIRAFRLPGAGGGSFPLYGGTFARSYSVSKEQSEEELRGTLGNLLDQSSSSRDSPENAPKEQRRRHSEKFRQTQECCGGLRGENPGAFPQAGLIFQQPCSLPQNAQPLAHRNRSDFYDLRLRCPSRTQKSQRFPRQEKAVLHCDVRVRRKVASDLRFRAAISEPKAPSFCGISGDLTPSMRKSLAIAIVRFW